MVEPDFEKISPNIRFDVILNKRKKQRRIILYEKSGFCGGVAASRMIRN